MAASELDTKFDRRAPWSTYYHDLSIELSYGLPSDLNTSPAIRLPGERKRWEAIVMPYGDSLARIEFRPPGTGGNWQSRLSLDKDSETFKFDLRNSAGEVSSVSVALKANGKQPDFGEDTPGAITTPLEYQRAIRTLESINCFGETITNPEVTKILESDTIKLPSAMVERLKKSLRTVYLSWHREILATRDSWQQGKSSKATVITQHPPEQAVEPTERRVTLDYPSHPDQNMTVEIGEWPGEDTRIFLYKFTDAETSDKGFAVAFGRNIGGRLESGCRLGIGQRGKFTGLPISVWFTKDGPDFGSLSPQPITSEEKYWRARKIIDDAKLFREFLTDPVYSTVLPQDQLPNLLKALRTLQTGWEAQIFHRF